MAGQPLSGRKIAILLAPAGTEQAEFTEPRKAVQAAGAQVDVVGVKTGPVQTVNHDLEPGDTFTVDKSFGQVVRRRLRRPHRAGRLRSARTSCAVSAAAVKPSYGGFFEAWQAGRGDLPWPLDAGRGRCGPGPDAHLLPHPGH